MSYHFSINLRASFDDVLERTRSALAEHGFGVLTEIDVTETLRQKLGVDVPAYRILGACNPPFAHRALAADPAIGVLLPCNVVVRQNGDGVLVDFMDPEAVLDLVTVPGVEKVAHEVRTLLEQVRDALATR